MLDFGKVILHICKYSSHHPNPCPCEVSRFCFQLNNLALLQHKCELSTHGNRHLRAENSKNTTIVECNSPTLWMAKYHQFFLIPNVDTVPAPLYVRLNINRSPKRWKNMLLLEAEGASCSAKELWEGNTSPSKACKDRKLAQLLQINHFIVKRVWDTYE